MLFKRNLVVLFSAHALVGSCAAIMVLLNGFVGTKLAPSPSLATLAMGILVVGIAQGSLFAAKVMSLKGRRFGFMLGALFGVSGGLLAAASISFSTFVGFCLSAVLMGVNMAFVQQYRFAAAESVQDGMESKAISMVLLGGIVAAFLGPQTAMLAKDWFANAEFAGSFIMLSVLSLLGFGALSFYQTVRANQDIPVVAVGESSAFYKNITFYAAVAFALTGFGVMSLIMTATPLHMHHNEGYTLDQAAWVIQSHIVAMFLPSLISGWMINRLGILITAFLGLLCNVVCVVLALEGDSLTSFWLSLVLLGVGWNFLFVSGTTLLASGFRGADRFRIQSINDFSVFSVQALASLGAGFILHQMGWMVLNQISLMLLSACLVILMIYRSHERAKTLRMAS